MARRAAPITFRLEVPSGAGSPKYAEIKDEIVRAIRSGALSPGSRVPSTRRLAHHLGVARITVSTAYELLEAEGWIRSRRGAGSYVMMPRAGEPALDEGRGGPRREAAARLKPAAGGPGILDASKAADVVSSLGRRRGGSGSERGAGLGRSRARRGAAPPWRDPALQHAHSLADAPGVISFIGTRQDPSLFPMAEVRRSLNTVLQRDGGLALQAEEPEGFPDLRRAIARMLERIGVSTSWEHVIVTSGSQQAIDLAARVLVEPGDVVCTENPTFPGALEAFAARGARLVGLDMDAEGLVTGGLDSSVWRYRPRLIYTNPTFHNPTGSTLPLSRRKQLLRIASALGSYVVEDDGYSLLRYAGAPPPPLAALAEESGDAGRVVHLGSLSNVLPPGLRLGYICVPPPLQRKFVLAKQAADLHTSSLLQRAAAVYLDGDHVPAQLRRLRQVGRRRRNAVVRALEQADVPGLEWWRPAGGPSMWVSLPPRVHAVRLYNAAVERGVAFRIGAASYVGRPSYRTIGLSFLAHGPPAVQEGIRRLAALLREHGKER